MNEWKKTHPIEYATWSNAIVRCHHPKNSLYADYGGRGITVCDEWRENFGAFLAHIGPKPHPRLSLDRINNDKGYEPGNVRWATQQQQNLNRRYTKPGPKGPKPITFDGRSMLPAEWAAELGISLSQLYRRIQKNGAPFRLTP